MEKRRADIIAASVSDGIFLLRGDEILFANPVGETILGLPHSIPARGLRVSAPAPELENDSKGVRAVAAAISRMMPVEFEFSDSNGRSAFYLVQSYPITVELIEQVEHSFDRRTSALMDSWAGNTIVIARDITLVHESREAKKHFLATLSHEVKTPVTSLTMATRLLLKAVDRFPDPMQRQLVTSCAEDVERLRRVLDELLTVTQFDSLAQKLELKRVNLARFIRQAIQFFQPQAFEKGIELASDLPSDLRRLELRVDPTKISWALSNLLTNALRHTPKGGKVQVVVTSPREDLVEVRVKDSGPGIERSRQDRIFDRFSAYYALRVGRSGSVGMGLAIAREIITAHGGRIWLESEPGTGSEFCFSLPLGGMQENPKGEYSGASARGG